MRFGNSSRCAHSRETVIDKPWFTPELKTSLLRNGLHWVHSIELRIKKNIHFCLLPKQNLLCMEFRLKRCYLEGKMTCWSICGRVVLRFLAHLSWKLKWAFLITCRPASVYPSVCLSVRCPSSSSPEPLGQFQPNLAQRILGWRGFKFVQMKGPALFQGEIITK